MDNMFIDVEYTSCYDGVMTHEEFFYIAVRYTLTKKTMNRLLFVLIFPPSTCIMKINDKIVEFFLFFTLIYNHFVYSMYFIFDFIE